jgi:hypothetical protein
VETTFWSLNTLTVEALKLFSLDHEEGDVKPDRGQHLPHQGHRRRNLRPSETVIQPGEDQHADERGRQDQYDNLLSRSGFGLRPRLFAPLEQLGVFAVTRTLSGWLPAKKGNLGHSPHGQGTS